jgi:pyruvyltransferase
LIEDKRLRLPTGARILAVRGPLTRELVDGEVPETYGDPAVLLPRMYRPQGAQATYDVGLLPHYVDRDIVGSYDPAVKVIDVSRPWREVVDAVTACDVVISSSLHGIIVAEAYGIPTAWLVATDRIIGGRFKFWDYYLSCDREPPEPTTWSEGLLAALNRAEPGRPPSGDALVAAWQDR